VTEIKLKAEAILRDEADRLTHLLRGKAIKQAKRHRKGEILLEFDDGTRRFVDMVAEGLEISVTNSRGD
jgi:hypothetical protein